jgi:hypothetical protein
MKLLGIVVALGIVSTMSSPAEARHRAAALHPMCNILWPCAAPDAAPRQVARHHERRRHAARKTKRHVVIKTVTQVRRPAEHHHEQEVEKRRGPEKRASGPTAQILPHPEGCPHREFCGCGASVKIFGHSVRELWLASNWFRFPRVALAAGMVAVRRGHVFVIEEVLGSGKVIAYDANSGRHLTRRHVRSVAGYTIVDPHSGGRRRNVRIARG